MSGVRKACQGRPVTEGDLAVLAQKVEESVRQTGSSQVDTNEIGLAILGSAARTRRGRLPAVRERLPGVRLARGLRVGDRAAARRPPAHRRRRRGRRILTAVGEPIAWSAMYPLLFRTVLSRMDPETAHHAAMVVIRLLGIPPFSWAARGAHPSRCPSCGPRRSGLTLRVAVRRRGGLRQGRPRRPRAVRARLRARRGGHDHRDPAGRQPAAAAVPAHPGPRGHQPDGLQQPGRRGGRAAASRSCGAAPQRAVIGVNIGKSRVVDVADATADYVRSATTARTARRLPRRQRLIAEHAGTARAAGRRDAAAAARGGAGCRRADAAARQDRARPARRRGRGDRAPRRRSRPRRAHRDEHDDLARGAARPIRPSSPRRATAACPARR